MVAEVFVSFARDALDMNCGIEIPARVTTAVFTLHGTYARNWLLSKGMPLNHLLFHARQVEDHIGAKSLEDALVFVEHELNTPKRDLSFLGLKIDAATAILVGPVATLTLVLYFLAHLRHLRTIIRRYKLEECSWIGLFVDPLSVPITYASLVLLPTIANLGLIVASKDVETAMWPVGIVCTVAIFGCSILTGVEVHAVHLAIRTDPHEPWQYP
jgi:hypothetical protein